LRFIDVSGVGHSGKSALVDLLREFDGLWVPEYWFEFDLLRIPGGVFDLQHCLCADWSPVRSHAAIGAFHRVVEQMGVDPRWWDLPGLLCATSQRYDSRFRGRFRELSHRYADAFIVGRYRAEWPYDSLRDADGLRFLRKIAARLGFRGQLLRQVLLADGRDFAARTTAYLDELYRQVVPGDVHTAVLNNGFEPFNPLPGLDLLAGSRQLVVTRDPRDVYVSGQTAGKAAAGDRGLQAFDNDGFNKSFLATDDIKLFVTRYRLYHEKLYRGSDPRVLQLGFERLTGDYEASLRRVVQFLGLDPARHARARQHFDPEKSGRNVGLWKKYSAQDEVRYIERELREYLVE
jgi:hypothetical protein